MKLLVLGGTRYLGRHVVEAACARGHRVTLFHRGITNPDLFPEVEKVHGDRDRDLERLAGRCWDAVLDPSGYLPRAVRASCTALAGVVDHYVFISSISAYADNTRPGLVESDALAEMPPGVAEELGGETYGPLKARCEREVLAAFDDRASLVRPGLIFGPHDSTDRSGYWPMRVAEGGAVLAPGRPERPVQLIDVRDLALWLVRLVEARTTGVFNAVGPHEALAMVRLLEVCREVAGADAHFEWVNEQFLLDQGVAPFSEMPLWVPEPYRAFMDVNGARAWNAGLECRPLAETVRDTLVWARALPAGPRGGPGLRIPPPLTREREAELLRAWMKRDAGRPA